MPHLGTICLFGCLLLALGGGCAHGPLLRQAKNPLAPAVMNRDSVALEIFFVRLPLDDMEAYDAIWREVDESSDHQKASARLAENGFRLGRISGHLPAKVQELLDRRTAAEQPRAPEKAAPAAMQQPSSLATSVVDFENEQQVRIRRLQLRAGKRGEIVASGIHDSVPLLLCEGKSLTGRTLNKFQGELAVRVFPQGDGSALLEIVPEAHHGDPRNQFTGLDGEGAWRLESSRPRLAFDQFAVQVKLAPGELAVFSSARDLPGSLGHYFFSDQVTGRTERKIVLIRLSQTQLDDLFGEKQPAASEP